MKSSSAGCFPGRGSIVVRSILRVVGLAAAVGAAPGVLDGVVAHAADAPRPKSEVTLTINPDGSAAWNSEPLAGEPALEDKIAHQTLQTPRLELDVRFHSVGQLSDSNRQTLLDIVELTARFGYVHVETTRGGAKLTVLGPAAAEAPPPK